MKARTSSEAGIEDKPRSKRAREQPTENVAGAPPAEYAISLSGPEPATEQFEQRRPAEALTEPIAQLEQERQSRVTEPG